MPDLTDTQLPKIAAYKLPDLDLGPEVIYPAYENLSLLNLPASLCRWLDAPDLPHPPLDLPPLDDMAEGAHQVIVVLIDAVSYGRFRGWLGGLATDLNPSSSNTLLAPITSVVPSTTSTVLTTLWTGRSPAEHGILGYEVFLYEYGLVANMITHSPAAFDGGAGLLYRAGFNPETALPVPTLGPHLHAAKIETHAFLNNTIRRSGLSKMHYAGVEGHSFRGVPELWIGVRDLAETPHDLPRFIWVYYGGVDGPSHRFGPDSEQARAEFEIFIRTLQDNFISDLSEKTRRETLLLLLTDHGQIHTPLDPQYELRNHPSLDGSLHMRPCGENRLAYLYSRPEQVKIVTEYFEENWPNKFTLLPSEDVLQAGLFGPGIPADEARGRLGDLVAISHDNAYLWWASKPNQLIGRHGGLSEEEMVVPLLASRLG